MATWFTSDTHFGHKRIIELSERPFKDVDEMNWAMIARWNSVVEPEDTVYHLGDAVMGGLDNYLHLIDELNGHKVLVAGNHDKCSPAFKGAKNPGEYRNWQSRYREVFQEVEPWMRAIELSNGVKVILRHYPHGDERYAAFTPYDEVLSKYPLVCGHVHNEWRTNGNMFNVGVDVNGFIPVPESEIIDWLATL